MQAVSDEERIESLERKLDAGFAEMRVGFKAVRTEVRSAERELRKEIVDAGSDAHADYRMLVPLVFGLWATTMLGFIGVLINVS